MTRDEAVRLDSVVETLATLVGRFDEQEKMRADARREDMHWRGRMERKTDGLCDDMEQVRACITEMPCMMDEKIKACREDRMLVTKGAVALAADLRGFSVVVLKVGALAGAVTAVVLGVGRFFGWY